MNQYRTGLALLVAAACFVTTGCSNYSLAPVSGRVTYKGEPVVGVDVVFYPKAVGDDPDAGPFSFGTTDENGAFVLETRNGENGAVIGEHRVSFEYSEGGEEELDQEMIEQTKSEYEEALAENLPSLPAAKRRWEALEKKLDKTGRLPQKFLESAQVVTVPSGGTTEANFDLE